MIRGRPIWFLVIVLGGWTAVRTLMVLPVPIGVFMLHPVFVERASGLLPDVGRIAPVSQEADGNTIFVPEHTGMADVRQSQETAIGRKGRPAILADIGNASVTVGEDILAARLAFVHASQGSLALAGFAPGLGPSLYEAGVPIPAPHFGNRFAGSAWMLWRADGDAAPVSRGGRLGGSQAGGRVDYVLAPFSPLHPTLYGRVSSALQGIAAAEIAAGIAIRAPLPFPAIIAVERREAVSPGGRNDFAILVAGGVNPVHLSHGFRLDGYGQAGFIGINRHDAFVDGRLTVEHSIGEGNGANMRDLAFGAALWGSAQRGAARLDIGPQMSIRLHLGGTNLRLGVEWRARVAGDAVPSSGPALSIGADF